MRDSAPNFLGMLLLSPLSEESKKTAIYVFSVSAVGYLISALDMHPSMITPGILWIPIKDSHAIIEVAFFLLTFLLFIHLLYIVTGSLYLINDLWQAYIENRITVTGFGQSRLTGLDFKVQSIYHHYVCSLVY